MHPLDNEAFRGWKPLRDQPAGLGFIARDHGALLRLGPAVVNVRVPPVLHHKLANIRVINGSFVYFVSISRQIQHL